MVAGKRRVIPAVLVALTMLGSPMGAYAGEGEGREARYEKKHRMMQEVIRDLGLTKEQLEKIEGVRARTQEQKKALRTEVRGKKRQLKAELANPGGIDEARVDQLIGEISVLKTEKLKKHVEAILEIRSTLTPSQFAEFHKRMESKKDQD